VAFSRSKSQPPGARRHRAACRSRLPRARRIFIPSMDWHAAEISTSSGGEWLAGNRALRPQYLHSHHRVAVEHPIARGLAERTGKVTEQIVDPLVRESGLLPGITPVPDIDPFDRLKRRIGTVAQMVEKHFAGPILGARGGLRHVRLLHPELLGKPGAHGVGVDRLPPGDFGDPDEVGASLFLRQRSRVGLPKRAEQHVAELPRSPRPAVRVDAGSTFRNPQWTSTLDGRPQHRRAGGWWTRRSPSATKLRPGSRLETNQKTNRISLRKPVSPQSNPALPPMPVRGVAGDSRRSSGLIREADRRQPGPDEGLARGFDLPLTPRAVRRNPGRPRPSNPMRLDSARQIGEIGPRSSRS